MHPPPPLPRFARTHIEQYGSLRALRALGPTGPSPRERRQINYLSKQILFFGIQSLQKFFAYTLCFFFCKKFLVRSYDQKLVTTKRKADGELDQKREQARTRTNDRMDGMDAAQLGWAIAQGMRQARNGGRQPLPADTPLTLDLLTKYTKNPNYRAEAAKAVGKGRRSYKRRKYTRRSYGGGYRGRRFRGYGSYSMGGGGNWGAQWGRQLGARGGEYVGGAAANLVKQLTGFGDYAIKANALMPGGEINNPNTHGGVVYRGCEYLGDIISGAANSFNLQNFTINPGLESTFPKLSQFLANYEQYVIEGMFFEFRTMSADALNSTNTALGQVIMACNYNVLNPNFGTKAEMEEYDGGISVKPSESCKFFVECARSESPMDVLYTRATGVPNSGDPRMYDLGNFQIATNGLQGANVNVGELWISYQVAGLKPKLYSALGNYNSALLLTNDSCTNAAPFGLGTPVIVYQDPAGDNGWALDATGATLYFPVSALSQAYGLEAIWTGTATAVTFPSITGTSQVQTFTPIVNVPNAGATVSSCAITRIYKVGPSTPNNRASITLSGAVLPTAALTVRIRIYQIPNNIVG